MHRYDAELAATGTAEAIDSSIALDGIDEYFDLFLPRVDARSPIRIGDLVVTSDVEGVAMRSEPVSIGGRQFHAPGTIIGKALEPLEKGTGEILILLSLQ